MLLAAPFCQQAATMSAYKFTQRAVASPDAPQKPLVRKRARSGGANWVKVTTFWCITPKVEKSLKKCENAPCWHGTDVSERYLLCRGLCPYHHPGGGEPITIMNCPCIFNEFCQILREHVLPKAMLFDFEQVVVETHPPVVVTQLVRVRYPSPAGIQVCFRVQASHRAQEGCASPGQNRCLLWGGRVAHLPCPRKITNSLRHGKMPQITCICSISEENRADGFQVALRTLRLESRAMNGDCKPHRSAPKCPPTVLHPPAWATETAFQPPVAAGEVGVFNFRGGGGGGGRYSPPKLGRGRGGSGNGLN